MTLVLRPATLADAYSLWIWANDPETRRASSRQGAIDWIEHRRWLRERLASDQTLLLIAEGDDQQPVGTIRFDAEDHWRSARLSYTVAPEARGHGLGEAILRSGLERLERQHPGTKVDALVSPENGASRRLFAKLGWREDRGLEGSRERWVPLGPGR